MIQYQLLYLGSVRDKLIEENTTMEAHCCAANTLIAEKEGKLKSVFILAVLIIELNYKNFTKNKINLQRRFQICPCLSMN